MTVTTHSISYPHIDSNRYIEPSPQNAARNLEIARHYHQWGNVIPLNRKKAPLCKWKSRTDWTQQRQAAVDVDGMAWHRAKGIALVLGSTANGWRTVDFDKQPDRAALDAFLTALGLPADYPWIVITPGSGFHVHLTCPDLDPDAAKLDRDGKHGGHIELRARDMLITLPPSRHPSGGRYQHIRGDIPNEPPATVDAAALLAAYDAVTKAPAPAATPEDRTLPESSPRSDLPSDFKDLYERWCVEVVEAAAVRTWNIAPPNGNGWSRRNFRSPVRDDGQNADCSWSYTAHGFQDFATGDFHNTQQVADLLGVQTWDDFKAEHRPAPSKPRRQQRIEDTIQPVTLPTMTAHQTVNMRYISDLPVDDVLARRAVLIKSPLGTGKTELVKRVIEDLDRTTGGANVLVVTHRQALAADIAARLGLECYKSLPDHLLGSAHRLVITYNSLHKIGTRRQWDLVIVDEMEQFHSHLFSATFHGGEPHRAHNALVAVLRNARHFIGLDAHLTDTSAQWLHGAIDTAPYVIDNTYRHDWGTLTLHAREESVIAAALDAVQANRGPVVITTSSRKRSEVYHRMVCDVVGSADGVVLVNGENSSSADIQRFIDRINDDLPQLRALICTPSFGTGLDVTAPVDGVFGVMLNRPLVATDMLQMLGRYRNADQRHVYVKPLHQTDPRDWLDRYSALLEAAHDTRHRADFAAHGIGPVDRVQHDILRLDAKLQTAAAVQKTDLVSYFAAYATAEGFTLAHNNRRAPQTRRAMHDTADRLAEDRKARVLAADPVDRETFDRHQQDGTITPDVIAGHERWKIEHTVGLDITSTVYDDLHTSARRSALRRLADLVSDRERLKARDRQEASDNYLLSQRGHYTSTRDLTHEGIAVVFGTDTIHSTAEQTEAEIVKRLTPWLEANLVRVQRAVDRRDDLSADPMFVLRRLLKAVGLKLARRQVMRDGERFMMYWLDQETRDRWLAYARARLDAIPTNPENDLSFRACSNAAVPDDPAPLDLALKPGTGPPRRIA